MSTIILKKIKNFCIFFDFFCFFYEFIEILENQGVLWNVLTNIMWGNCKFYGEKCRFYRKTGCKIGEMEGDLF